MRLSTCRALYLTSLRNRDRDPQSQSRKSSNDLFPSGEERGGGDIHSPLGKGSEKDFMIHIPFPLTSLVKSGNTQSRRKASTGE